MIHVLIADDDKDLAEGLSWYLEAEGFRVSVAYDGRDALDAFRASRPDVAILDIMMPSIDGIRLCETIRSESDAFIMMLSARDGEIDKVRALTLGADDYVTKPFHASEIVARIKAMLRRKSAEPRETNEFRWKDLVVVADQRAVTVKGTPVDLTSMEFELLLMLMRRPRAVIPREELVKAVWGEDFYGELRLVDNHIYRLREKLAKAGLDGAPIVTVRGVGYAYRPED